MKLASKVLMTLSVLAILTFVSLVIALVSFNKLDSSFESFVKKDVVFLSEYKNIYSYGLQRGQAVRNVILNPSDKKARENFKKASDDSTKLLEKLSQMSSMFLMEKKISEMEKLTGEDISIQSQILEEVNINKDSAIEILNKKETPLWRELKSKYFKLEKDIFNQFGEKEKQIKADIGFYKSVIIVLSVILFLILAFMYSVFNKIIINPIETIVKSIERDSSGNISINSIDIQSNDEIGKLAITINDLTSQVRSFTQSVKKSTEDLHLSFRELNEAAEQTSQGSQQVAISTESLAVGTQDISNHLEEGAKNIGVLNISIQNLSKQSNEVIEIGNETQSSANQSKIQVESAVSKIKSIKNVSDKAAGVVIELGGLSKEIAQIVDIIKNIASQTNLLALNAAIEAARAGEHGKGFAVVAEEVKKLANESGKATEKITDMIKEIQDKTKIAVESMKKASTEVDDGVSVIHEVDIVLENIINQVNQANSKIVDNVNQIEDIAANSKQIVEVIEKVTSIMESAVTNAEEISCVAEEQTASVEEINATTVSLSHVAERLNDEVSIFKV